MRTKQVFFLNREGEIIDKIGTARNTIPDSRTAFPVVVDYYEWDINKQAKSAEKYKDQIRRVFYQNEIEGEVKPMIKDDIRRLEVVQGFNYGAKVLEVGSSDGTVSIKIAQQPKVKEVLAIDIRQSAIVDGKKLLKDLVKRGELTEKIAGKISLKKYAIEDLPSSYGQFDSVCAYEIFEHLSPWDLMPVFKHLYKFIKPTGAFFISVPNRFPDAKYEKEGRSRWRWFDHRNFFSQLSLQIFLTSFFKDVKFYSLYQGEKAEKSLYLICECRGKKF